jgi:ADP-heptose:LPS heptosyltransferase
MRRVLVLQMCRLGDILQTVPMLRGLRREHPEAEITLVLHDLFERVPIPGRLYDRLVPFPYTQLVAPIARDPNDWPRALARLREWVASLGAAPFDLAINLTHTDLSNLLMVIVPAREHRGGVIAPDRTRVVRGDWMPYFWASQTSRVQGCFNLVDLQNWAAGVACDAMPLEIEIPDAARQKIGQWLADRGLGDRPLVAMQLGASEERKRWPAEAFAQAADLLDPADGEIVLVGAGDERHLGERAMAHARRRLHAAYGETTILELAALLERCRLLITNDTGTMHVATAAGTRIIDISTGPVFVHETGPYGPGHFVIEPRTECFPCIAGSTCHHFSCREAIAPGDVASLARHVLGRGPFPHPERARILTGVFLPSRRIEYRTIWPVRGDASETVRRLSARAWEETLCAPGVVAGAAGRGLEELDLPADRVDQMVAALEGIADQATAASRLAGKIARAPSAGASRLAAGIDAHLAQMEIGARIEPIGQPLVGYLKVRLSALAEPRVPNVARGYALECAATARRARRLAALLLEAAGYADEGSLKAEAAC